MKVALTKQEASELWSTLDAAHVPGGPFEELMYELSGKLPDMSFVDSGGEELAERAARRIVAQARTGVVDNNYTIGEMVVIDISSDSIGSLADALVFT